jgi:hydroxypyruvate reductase
MGMAETLHGGAPDRLLRALFDAALDAVSAERCVPPHLPPRPAGRTVVVGAGKAAASMAAAVERHWDAPLAGVVVVPYGHAVACRRIAVIEAAHPLPDEAGMAAARRVLEAVRSLSPDDLVLALISGGGSALLALPAPGITLADKQAVTAALLRCGAPIAEINAVRSRLSAIKGGRLAAAARPARVATLVVSDVPGDDPATVASGPTLAGAATAADAQSILARYGIDPPPAIAALLAAGGAAPKRGSASFAADTVAVVARARDALAAAAALAAQSGLTCDILGDAIEGEARDVGRAHAVLAAEPGTVPRLLLSGGETTVTLAAGTGGAGGRNTEFLLALALALDGRGDVSAIACDTDGIDGDAGAAGAILRPDSLARARALGLDPGAMLEAHRSGEFFAALGDLVRTGPTRTNVNDFRAVLVNAAGAPPGAGTGAPGDL